MSVTIGIVDYGMGNLCSVAKAIEHVGGNCRLVSDPRSVGECTKLILPGVGAFGDAMRELQQRGLVEVIRRFVEFGKPLFGICLGMQLLFDSSEEHGSHEGLGLVPGQVVRFEDRSGFKVPHMGWNTVCVSKGVPGFESASPLAGDYYFVHSYYVIPSNSNWIWMETDYGHRFCSAIARGNLFATQFHPEKSQVQGLGLLRAFVNLA